MFRKISIILNSIVVLTSLALFAYTYFAKSHLTKHTQEFLTKKTLSYSKSIIEVTKVGLESPLSNQVISGEQRKKIEQEIVLYESSPEDYVITLTSHESVSLGHGKTAKIKEKIRAHYQSTLSELIRDLRIFSGSNFVAGIFCLYLLFAKNLMKKDKVITFSFIIFAAVAYSTYNYIDGISFLKILFKWNLGWWYPVGIVMTIISLVLEHGLQTKSNKQQSSN